MSGGVRCEKIKDVPFVGVRYMRGMTAMISKKKKKITTL
jgi:hypothetical protein